MTTPKPPSMARPPTPHDTGLGRDADASMSAYAQGKSGIASTSSRGGSQRGLVPYPDPFSTMSSAAMPTTLRGWFNVCKKLAKYSPVHKGFVKMMSTLPVTDLTVKPLTTTSDALKGDDADEIYGGTTGEDASVHRIQTLTVKHWNLRKANQKVARSYFTYSNALAVISYPFRKLLKCTKCGHVAPASSSKWKLYEGGKFHWKCPKCERSGQAHVWDHMLRIPEDVRLIVLPIERIDALRNEMRDTYEVYYEIPQSTVDRLTCDPLDKTYVCELPQAYLEAALGGLSYPSFTDQKPRVRLTPGMYYLMQQPSLNDDDDGTEGLAFPEMAATWQDFWLRKVQQKSQEAVHSELAMPKRFLFPQSQSASGSIFELVNVQSLMSILKDESARQRVDPGYVAHTPFPVGQAVIGGEAKPVSLAADIKVQAELEAAGLGVPIEAIFGGLQFSGASVSLQQVMTWFEDFRSELIGMDRWFIDHVSLTMKIPKVAVELKKFRMGEDIPYLQMLSALVSQNFVSMKHLHDALNLDSESERKQIQIDAEFRAALSKLQGKSDASVQEEILQRQMAAQAAGEVIGVEAKLDENVELVKKVRNNEELMEFVMANPSMISYIFGESSPEAQQNAMMTPAMLPPAPEQMQGGDFTSQQFGVEDLGQYIDEFEPSFFEEQAVEGAEPAYAPPGG